MSRLEPRIRLYGEQHGTEVVYDGGTGTPLLDAVAKHSPVWGVVDFPKMRMCGTFRIFLGLHQGMWWEFEQDDSHYLKYMLWSDNPAVVGVGYTPHKEKQGK